MKKIVKKKIVAKKILKGEKLSVINDWGYRSYSVAGKSVNKIKEVIIDNKVYKIIEDSHQEQVSDHSHSSSVSSPDYLVSYKLFKKQFTISLYDLLEKKVKVMVANKKYSLK